MDLLVIVRTLWRFKIAAALVVLLTLGGCAAVLVMVAPVYETSSSYLLLQPPAPPTQAEIERDPRLRRIRSDNPYLRFTDPSVIINVVSRRVNEDTTRERLVAAGADERYEVMPSNRFGFSSPIIDITSQASDPGTALRTVEVVGEAVTGELRKVQAAEKVDPKYMITTRQVEKPVQARQRAAGRLRAVLGVLGLGGVALLVMISSLQAWDRHRNPTAPRGLPVAPPPAGRHPADPPPSGLIPSAPGQGYPRPWPTGAPEVRAANGTARSEPPPVADPVGTAAPVLQVPRLRGLPPRPGGTENRKN